MRDTIRDPHQDARQDQDLEFVTEYAPAHYAPPKDGRGRWVLLATDAGDTPLGYLWTSDEGGLGYVPTTDQGRQRTPEFYQAFSRAAALGVPAADVFADWASRAGLGLSAGPIQEGDLDTLPD